ncbi:nuclear transport factor 2 family protein [Halomonas sp. MCCC 1A17488]|uniref:Nuclear transport factor 2 family protein n=1 Tax=Billgrantia sulfidoxydans TaxID=2733484 RepID=A0ABX7W316_9GAMM|nr:MULTISPECIES: nuclear transport factor 2 family protein [Halomonas]MCE8015535.1 nuclear transport factor 2 family protein [Halomonas sp. MCCC 1A17488]MCG3238868.1 nuclear transport factor 2 family protein [Halomonas sp. MCCC 1A17488]QPP51171.1 nuclear transport factor 2 family protein [Halomonas sp. SS10-MC5]QTP54739.1 nuclear transport factor 2 family protein [Halomonas sulfidoxydans]
MDDATKRDLIERYITAYNNFDIDGMLAVLDPGISFENYSGDELTTSANGIDEFRQLAEHAKGFFAERVQRVSSLTLSQDGATAEIDYHGRLAQDIPGGPKAGSLIELNGVSEFTFGAGRIIKIIDRS